jgi:hypothetical protein
MPHLLPNLHHLEGSYSLNLLQTCQISSLYPHVVQKDQKLTASSRDIEVGEDVCHQLREHLTDMRHFLYEVRRACDMDSIFEGLKGL